MKKLCFLLTAVAGMAMASCGGSHGQQAAYAAITGPYSGFAFIFGPEASFLAYQEAEFTLLFDDDGTLKASCFPCPVSYFNNAEFDFRLVLSAPKTEEERQEGVSMQNTYFNIPWQPISVNGSSCMIRGTSEVEDLAGHRYDGVISIVGEQRYICFKITGQLFGERHSIGFNTFPAEE